MLKLLLFTLVFVSTLAQDCPPLRNKILKSLQYGAFDKPRIGVSKTEADGAVTFQSPGATKVVFSTGKIEEFQHVAGVNTVVTILHDDACNVTSVNGATFGGVQYLSAKADAKECAKIRAKSMMPHPNLLSIGETISLAWCADYFPLPKKAEAAASSTSAKGAGVAQ